MDDNEMTEGRPTTPEEFEEKFRDSIRVGLNWERFLAERWPIERVSIASDEELARCITPWYVGRLGEELPYDHMHAVPMSIHDVPKAFSLLSEERKADIQEKIDYFKDGASLIHLIVPTYALPNERYFVLDKNHRLSALALSEKPFEVELWNVQGPFEKECLLDLDFWLREDFDERADE